MLRSLAVEPVAHTVTAEYAVNGDLSGLWEVATSAGVGRVARTFIKTPTTAPPNCDDAVCATPADPGSVAVFNVECMYPVSTLWVKAIVTTPAKVLALHLLCTHFERAKALVTNAVRSSARDGGASGPLSVVVCPFVHRSSAYLLIVATYGAREGAPSLGAQTALFCGSRSHPPSPAAFTKLCASSLGY